MHSLHIRFYTSLILSQVIDLGKIFDLEFSMRDAIFDFNSAEIRA